MVGDVRELHALLGEASSVLSKRFSRFLLALAEVPRIAEADVGPLEVALEHPDQIGPIVDLVGWEFLEPPASNVGDEKWKLSDDGSIVPSSTSQLACQPEIRQP
jgi:hypothetical protein